jgi:crossover junction endodeoxyribonuclease RusA
MGIGAGSAIIELPWTAPPLTLNQRRATRGAMFARAAKIAAVRQAAYELATAAGLPRGLDHVTVTLHYRPRDKRRRDTDNLVDTAKPCYDALTDGRPARWSKPKDPKKKPRLLPAQLGCGLVPDDIPKHMAKPEPRIHAAEKGTGGAMWLEITWGAQEIDYVPSVPAPAPELSDSPLGPIDPVAPDRKPDSAPKPAASRKPRQTTHRTPLHTVPDVVTSVSSCPVCGSEIVQPLTGRPRKTCSGACRVRAFRATAAEKNRSAAAQR